MKFKITALAYIILGCNTYAENYVGWSDGVSYRKGFNRYIVEISTMPYFTRSNKEDETGNSGDRISMSKQNRKGFDFSWANSFFLGKTIAEFKRFKMNSGLKFSYEYNWSDNKVIELNDRWTRDWDEAHRFNIGVIVRPSFKVFDRILLETGYGIVYSGQYQESKLVTQRQTSQTVRDQNAYLSRYKLIGSIFSLNMGFNVFLKI